MEEGKSLILGFRISQLDCRRFINYFTISTFHPLTPLKYYFPAARIKGLGVERGKRLKISNPGSQNFSKTFQRLATKNRFLLLECDFGEIANNAPIWIRHFG